MTADLTLTSFKPGQLFWVVCSPYPSIAGHMYTDITAYAATHDTITISVVTDNFLTDEKINCWAPYKEHPRENSRFHCFETISEAYVWKAIQLKTLLSLNDNSLPQKRIDVIKEDIRRTLSFFEVQEMFVHSPELMIELSFLKEHNNVKCS